MAWLDWPKKKRAVQVLLLMAFWCANCVLIPYITKKWNAGPCCQYSGSMRLRPAQPGNSKLARSHAPRIILSWPSLRCGRKAEDISVVFYRGPEWGFVVRDDVKAGLAFENWMR